VPNVGENVKYLLFFFLSFLLYFLFWPFFHLLTVGAGSYCTDQT